MENLLLNKIFANVKQLNLIDLQKYDKIFNEIISSLNPLKFFFPFLEEIAHIYYCKKFIDNVNHFYYDINQNNVNECNQPPAFDKTLNDFRIYIMREKQPLKSTKSRKFRI